MRPFLSALLAVLAVVGQAETFGNPQTHWFTIASPEVQVSDVLVWSDTLGLEKTAVFMNATDVVSFEQYCRLIGWDDWLATVIDDRKTDYSRQRKISELVLGVVSGAFAAATYQSNPTLGVTLSGISVWSLVHGLIAFPEADRPLTASPRTWQDLIEASR